MDSCVLYLAVTEIREENVLCAVVGLFALLLFFDGPCDFQHGISL